MKIKTLKLGLLVIVGCIAMTASAPRVFASEILSQQDFSSVVGSVQNPNSTTGGYAIVPTSQLSPYFLSLGSYTLKIRVISGTSTAFNITQLVSQIDTCRSVTSGVCTYPSSPDVQNATATTSITAPGDYYVTFPVFLTLNQSYAYYLFSLPSISGLGYSGVCTGACSSVRFQLLGDSSDVNFQYDDTSNFPPDTHVSSWVAQSPYFWLDTNATPPSYISGGGNHISISSPAPLSTTASTTVTFSGTYYVDSSITFSSGAFTGCDVVYYVSDGLGGISPSNVLGDCSVTDSIVSWSASAVLVTGRQYTAIAQLNYGSLSNSLYSSPPVIFNVVSAPSNDITQYANCNALAIAGCIQNAFIYLFVPTSDVTSQFSVLTLKYSLPFSYVYDTQVLLSDFYTASQTSTSTLYLSVPLSYGGSNVFGTSSIDIISPALINSVSFYPYVRSILGFLFIFFTAFGIYEIVIRAHDNTTK